MVVWLFAGGGEAEVRGLRLFLEKNFTCVFGRKTPVRQKPGPKPTKEEIKSGYGRTGKSLANQLKEQLEIAIKNGGLCDLILVLDDLDCHDATKQEQYFFKTIDSVPGAAGIARFVGFAAPELEVWLIADWDHTIARHVDFRQHHQAMRWWLSHEKKVSFGSPETFSFYDTDKDSCHEKLSDLIIDAALETGQRYSKAIHTPHLLQEIDPQTVRAKCPFFRQLYLYLSQFCQE